MATTYPQLSTGRPKFCTIILDEEANDLKIEHEFARRHGRYLPRTVILKVHASDKIWEVEVFKSDCGDILLRNGWEEFKRNYSVAVGDFMVFMFDGSSSMFDVFIYDMTCVHIECTSGEETGSETDGGLGESSESQETQSDEMAFRREQESMRKRSRSAGPDTENDESDESLSSDESDGSLSSDEAGGSRTAMTRKFTKQLSIHELYTLKLPKYFTKGIQASGYIMLKDVKGREMKVNLCGTTGKYTLGAGWKNFLIKNKVTIGSTLSFELVSVPYNVIEVVVVKMAADKNKLFKYVRKRRGKPYIDVPHAHSGENTGDHPDNKDTVNVIKQEGGSSSRTNCSFRRQIPFSSRHRLELTKEFIRRTGMDSHSEITLRNVKGRGWSVVATCRTAGRCTLGSGWHNFLTDNKVTVGSMLDFKSVSTSSFIEVRVVKPGPNPHHLFTSIRRRTRRKLVANGNARGRKGQNDKRFKKEEENVPPVGNTLKFSMRVMAHHAYNMYIPRDLVRVTGIKAKSKIRLRLGGVGEWLVDVVSDQRCYRYSIATGWNTFVKDNQVLEGSTLSFEFIPNSDNLMEVQVLNNGTKGKPLVPLSNLSPTP